MEIARRLRSVGRQADARFYVAILLVSLASVALLEQSGGATDHGIVLFLMLGATTAAAAYGGLVPSLALMGITAITLLIVLAISDRLRSFGMPDALTLAAFFLAGLSIGAACEGLHRRCRRAELANALSKALLVARLAQEQHERSAQAQATDALMTADRRKDAFLATLAHELRNPLTAINTATQVLIMIASNDARVSAHAGIINRQAAQLTRLVDELFDISRIVHDRLELKRERVDLRDIITAVIETFGELRHSHELLVTLPTQSVELDADSMRLAQLFGNLLGNAGKYTPAGGRIHLTVETVADSAIIRIRDTGIGIEPSQLPYVFDPFYQADSAAPHASSGLGIGLGLVRRLTQLHGGTVEADSAGLGCGSEFVVSLPLPVTRPHVDPDQPSPSEGDESFPSRAAYPR
jgi:signal transduction histidine kinase